jgi:hypothetical protein
VGALLNAALDAVIDEKIPNERGVILNYLQRKG